MRTLAKGFYINKHGRRVIRVEYSCFYLAMLSVVLFNENVRSMILSVNGAGNLVYFNVPYLVSSGILLVICIKMNKASKTVLYISFSIMLISVVNMHYKGSANATILLGCSSMLYPLGFVAVRVKGSLNREIFQVFLSLLNFTVFCLLVFGVIDYFTGRSLGLFLGNRFFPEEMRYLVNVENAIGIYRMYSFIGHPLTNAFYFLTFYCMNTINNKYYKKRLKTMVIIGVTMLGLILSASKTAMILAVLLIIISGVVQKRRLGYGILVLSMLVALCYTPIFRDNLLIRFIDGANTGDITSGRNTLVKQLLQCNIRPDFILGDGIGYSRVVARSLLGDIFNFEYPVIMFAFDYGVLITIMIYIVLLGYPLVCFIRNKSWYIFVCFLALFLFVNSNNGLSSFSDIGGLFSIILILLVNLSNQRKATLGSEVMMKKIIISDFVEYNDPNNKLGNFHYANCFAKDGYEVLWMSNPFNQLVYFKDKQDYLYKKTIATAERHLLAPGIYGFAPYSRRLYGNYPFSRNASIVLNNEKYIMPNIKKSLGKMDFEQVDLLWISNPKHLWVANAVKYKKMVFRIPDAFRSFDAFPKSVECLENALIDRADTVFVTSKLLEAKVEERNKQPLLLNNAVDFNHFRKQLEPPIEYNYQRNRIVYVGAINNWLDIELIKKAAFAMKDFADIYLVGRPAVSLSLLNGIDNVHILGARPYMQVPAYLQHADVAIIPFIKNELTDAVSPIKLYEYCTAGLGIVTTALTEIRNSNAPVYIANNHQDFIAGIIKYLREGYDNSSIIEFGRNNSWGNRFEDVKRELEL